MRRPRKGLQVRCRCEPPEPVYLPLPPQTFWSKSFEHLPPGSQLEHDTPPSYAKTERQTGGGYRVPAVIQEEDVHVGINSSWVPGGAGVVKAALRNGDVFQQWCLWARRHLRDGNNSIKWNDEGMERAAGRHPVSRNKSDEAEKKKKRDKVTQIRLVFV